MADLEIDYHLYPVFPANRREVYFLDRAFLAQDDDLAISRAPDAPCLRWRAGSWWLDNDSDRNEAIVTLWAPAVGRQEVPRRASYALPDGQIEIHPWGDKKYPVLVTVSASDSEATRPGRGRPRPGGITRPGLPDADKRLDDLFHEHHSTRIVLAAHFREYLIRGSRAPRPQDRKVTARCMGFDKPGRVDSALQQAQRAVWGGLGHAEELPGFLVNRDHLRPEHHMLVPHHDCEHSRP